MTFKEFTQTNGITIHAEEAGYGDYRLNYWQRETILKGGTAFLVNLTRTLQDVPLNFSTTWGQGSAVKGTPNVAEVLQSLAWGAYVANNYTVWEYIEEFGNVENGGKQEDSLADRLERAHDSYRAIERLPEELEYWLGAELYAELTECEEE